MRQTNKFIKLNQSSKKSNQYEDISRRTKFKIAGKEN